MGKQHQPPQDTVPPIRLRVIVADEHADALERMTAVAGASGTT